jgi:hypothetical protein
MKVLEKEKRKKKRGTLTQRKALVSTATQCFSEIEHLCCYKMAIPGKGDVIRATKKRSSKAPSLGVSPDLVTIRALTIRA